MMRLVVALVLAVVLAAGLVAPAGVAAKPGGAGGIGKDACKKGGYLGLYRADGSPFADQGECVSYVAGGGVLSSTPRLSPGCAALNEPGLDGLYEGAGIADEQFFMGEVVTVSGAEPTVGGPDGFLFDAPPYIFPAEVLLPGSISDTVPANGLYDYAWYANIPGSLVTFTVSCG